MPGGQPPPALASQWLFEAAVPTAASSGGVPLSAMQKSQSCVSLKPLPQALSDLDIPSLVSWGAGPGPLTLDSVLEAQEIRRIQNGPSSW